MNIFNKNSLFDLLKNTTKEVNHKSYKLGKLHNSNNYSISQKDYYLERLYPNTILGYEKLFFSKNSFEVTTTKLIEPKEYVLNSTYDQITKIHGSPRITVKQDDSIKTAFYKNTNSKKKIITQLHFLNNILFYVSIGFSDLTSNEKQQLIEALQIKHHILALKYNNIILDQNKNRVMIEDDVYTRISYLSGNEKLQEGLREKCCTFSSSKALIENPFTDHI